ncbi:AMP deaminase 2 at C-terminar half [Coccomyxa sp. Obi]|nr:AMP deaminase 2 at C-terminar half [Coccomyxa sp. Obi]
MPDTSTSGRNSAWLVFTGGLVIGGTIAVALTYAYATSTKDGRVRNKRSKTSLRPVSPRRRRHSAINGENGEYLNTNGGTPHPEGPWDKRRNPQQDVMESTPATPFRERVNGSMHGSTRRQPRVNTGMETTRSNASDRQVSHRDNITEEDEARSREMPGYHPSPSVPPSVPDTANVSADERAMSLTPAQREQLFKAGLGGGRGGGTGGGTVLRAHTYMADQYKQTQLMQHAHASGNASANALAQTLVPHSFQHPVPHLPHTHAHNVSAHSTNPATVDSVNDLVLEGKIIEDAAVHEQYSRVITPEPAMNEETEDVCALLQQCLDIREKWLFKPAVQPEHLAHLQEVAKPSLVDPDPFEWTPQEPSDYQYELVDGIMRVYHGDDRSQEAFPLPGNSYDFFSDMHWILRISAMGPTKSLCHHRLMLLEQKFRLHQQLNSDKEFLAQKSAPHRDFYNVRKVDTHVHHSACMHQKHLLRFIKSKLRKEPDEVVIFRDGKWLTLKEVFESLHLTGYDLNVDTLDMHADKNTFHRFDRFNLKYNPFGQSRLREIFIKQDNLLHGSFLAELTKEVLSDLEASKYQHAEYRISIYGRKRVEWDILAAWIVQNQLYSDNVVWLIQIPRLYDIYKAQGLVDNFEQLLDNIFTPLFEVTVDPNSHPQLHLFLKQVVGFDMVDDESKPERRPAKHMKTPREWDLKHNPAYAYYAFYTYANLYILNKLREARGLNTFALRPHAGEAGDVDHLVSALMLCENIAHGINLRKNLPLQYLFYLAQIGLCMSPLSNNSLFLDYHKNPFPTFFARGLSLSLSTDDPVQIHLTKEPLVEEYSVAAQVWKLSATDLCEIARNSVLHSGFPHQVKMHWVHQYYWLPGPQGNDIHKTNVPNLRMRFRYDNHQEEVALVKTGAAAHAMRMEAANARKELA